MRPFSRDDVGYISHIVPPRESVVSTVNIEFNSIDVAKTVGVASTGHLYLYQETNEDQIPQKPHSKDIELVLR